jgi:PAS domain S-box-containing protein
MNASRNSPPKHLAGAPQRVSAGLGWYALLAGVVSLLGWVLDVRALTVWTGNGISIQPNSAVAGICAGLALILWTARRKPVEAAALGAVSGLIGAASLFENISGLGLGFDSLLLFGRTWGSAGTLAPGRMGVPASIGWTLAGGALMMAASPRGPRRAVPLLGLVVAALAGVSLVAYLFGSDTLYSLPRLTAIAMQTATILFAVGLGLVAAIPEHQPMRTLCDEGGGGLLARRTLPWIVGLPTVLAFFEVLGERAGLYDPAMGSSLLLATLIPLTAVVLWRGVAAVAIHEAALTAANQALGRAELVFRTATEQFILLHPDWTHAYVNDRVCQMTGIPRAELVGRAFWQMFPELAGSELETVLRRVMERREPETVEHHYARWDRWFEVRAYPAPDEGLALFILDATERKQAEAALQAADRRKDEFLAMLAHELRNPLAPIRTAARIMRLQGSADGRFERQQQVIERQVGNLTRLIEDLLDVSRITRSAIALRPEHLDGTELVSQAAEISRPLLDEQGHELRIRGSAEALPLLVDRLRLEQVLSNLLLNAAKYTDPGGVITFECAREAGNAVFRVRDNGRGISPELLPRVFDLFVQDQRSPDRSQGGLGIGLTVVKHLVELHGGAVQARSEGPGRGSEFIVRLPLAHRDGTAAAAGEEPRSRATVSRGEPGRILVVDDNQDAAETLSELLELWDYEVLTACGGQAGLAAADRFRPDVVLLDIGMPGMDGYEVAKQLRLRPQHGETYLIALTGYGQPEDRNRAQAAGFNEHLAKPFDPDHLQGLLAARFPG